MLMQGIAQMNNVEYRKHSIEVSEQVLAGIQAALAESNTVSKYTKELTAMELGLSKMREGTNETSADDASLTFKNMFEVIARDKPSLNDVRALIKEAMDDPFYEGTITFSAAMLHAVQRVEGLSKKEVETQLQSEIAQNASGIEFDNENRLHFLADDDADVVAVAAENHIYKVYVDMIWARQQELFE